MCKVYDVVNSRIMELLQQGTVPWRKGWGNSESNYPKNLVSKKEYRGINVFLLGCQQYRYRYRCYLGTDLPSCDEFKTGSEDVSA